MNRTRRLVAVAVLVGVGLVGVSAAPAHAAPRSPSAPAQPLVYVVVRGDSLTVIANKLHVTMSDLLAVNHLQRSSVIVPGAQLTVPPGGSLPAPPPPAPTLTYTVAVGDSLTGIALKLKVSVKDLLSANKLTRSSAIHPGGTLLVPAGGVLPVVQTAPAASSPPAPATDRAGHPFVYVVRSGDFLIGIATLLGVTLDGLLTTNSLTRASVIHPGTRLLVPAGGHLPASGPGSSPSSGGGKIDAVVSFARAQLGKPYRFNAAGPDAWDCSGLTMAAYAQIGISLPHYSAAQAVLGTRVDWTTQPIRPGDLVFLETSPGSGVINHVGIAINATQWIQAPRTGDVVRISTFSLSRVTAVRRFVQQG